MALVDLIPVDTVPSVKWAPTANTRRIYDRNVFVNDTAFTTPPVVNMVGLPVRAISDEVTIYPKAINAVMIDPTGTDAINAGIWYVDVMVSADPDVSPNFLYVTMTHPSWSGPETRIVPHGSGPLCWTDLAAAVPETPTNVIFIGGGGEGAPVLTIGTVTEGATPSVTAVPGGTPGHYTLNFVLKPGQNGSPGTPGSAGESAYQLAVAGGYSGSQSQWLNSLRGADGSPGVPGLSAYQIAVAGGYSGTQAEWLASLVGAQGDPGAPGQPGTNGANGQSAYQLAVAGGYSGTQAEWLASLKGDQGDPGPTSIVILEPEDPDPDPVLNGILYVRLIASTSLDTTPPTSPSGVTQGTTTSTSIAISWTPSTDAVGVYGYEIIVNGVAVGSVLTPAATYTIQSLIPNTDYTVQLRARDAANNWSALSAPVTMTTAESGGTESSLLWEDNFQRADASGNAAVGNGWGSLGTTDIVANIISNQLAPSGTGGFQRLVTLGGGAGFPDDMDLVVILPRSRRADNFYGVILRYDANTNTGVRVFVENQVNDMTIGSVAGYNAENVAVSRTGPVPANWNSTDDIEMRVSVDGVNISVYFDDSLFATATVNINNNGATTGRAIGLCGELSDSGARWGRIAAYTVSEATPIYSTQHTIFAGSHPGNVTQFGGIEDNGNPIELGDGYYRLSTVSSGTDYPSMRCIGARLYVPNTWGGVPSGSVRFRAYQYTQNGTFGTLLAEKTVPITRPWTDCYWDLPFAWPANSQNVFITYQFVSNPNLFVGYQSCRADDNIAMQASDGTKIFWAENTSSIPALGTNPSSGWVSGSSYGAAGATRRYGTDVILDEGAP